MGGKIAQHIVGRRAAGIQTIILLTPAPRTRLVLSGEMRTTNSCLRLPKNEEFVVRNVFTSPPITDNDVQMTVSDCRSCTDVATVVWPTYAAGEDISDQVGNINVPVLIPLGQHDRVEPLETVDKEVVARISGEILL